VSTRSRDPFALRREWASVRIGQRDLALVFKGMRLELAGALPLRLAPEKETYFLLYLPVRESQRIFSVSSPI
jgi:hypothetical protein